MYGDARSLPFQDQFDWIVAFNSLHWVREIHTALEKIRDALVSNGKVLILVAPVQVRHPLHQIIDEMAKQEKWCGYFDNAVSLFCFKTLGEWANAIEEANMVPEKLEFIDASFEYPSIQAFADSLSSWVPYGKIPEDNRLEFIDEIVTSYLKRTPCLPNGRVLYCLDELVIVASKN